MDGSAVFQFVQTEVPPLIAETYSAWDWNIEGTDYFFFHQPNRFMLQKLADRCGIPREKMPMDIVEKYGNPSGASIPLAISDTLKNARREQKIKCCMSAFGSGLAWGAMLTEIGPLDFCEMAETPL
jgi:3-oxoacyl-[acyl-carrier-protein] synthase-3